MSGRSSRRKGHGWEREVARQLRAIFGDGVRRTIQSRAGTAEGSDVQGTPFRIEAKFHRRQPSIPAALQQAAGAPGDSPPLAVTKCNHMPAIASMYWEDFLALLRKAYEDSDSS